MPLSYAKLFSKHAINVGSMDIKSFSVASATSTCKKLVVTLHSFVVVLCGMR